MPDTEQAGMLTGWKGNVANMSACAILNVLFYAIVMHGLSTADQDRELLKGQLEASQKQVTDLSNQLYWSQKETVESLKEVVARQKKATATLESVEKKVEAPK
jgi:hypothetical protein